jgi:isopenicillin N synthase-like dioxygenase
VGSLINICFPFAINVQFRKHILRVAFLFLLHVYTHLHSHRVMIGFIFCLLRACAACFASRQRMPFGQLDLPSTPVFSSLPCGQSNTVCLQEVHDFFDLPVSYKSETSMAPDYPYGYGGFQGEKAGNEHDYSSGDQKESWQACLGVGESTKYGVPEVRWPKDLPAFREAFTAYYNSMEHLSATLLRIFALALRLPETYFEDKTDKHWCALRTLNYPHQEKPPAPGALRISPHSDYGTLTILRADDAPGGLQVLKQDGGWMDVKMHPDSFVINIGDLMQRWTNDRWMSTVHRVINPPTDVAAMVSGHPVCLTV